MKKIIINVLLIVGIVGLIRGYPELAYLSGIAKILDYISEVMKGGKISILAFLLAIFAGLGFASISPFSWWQGILYGFTIEGIIIMILSLFSNKRTD